MPASWGSLGGEASQATSRGQQTPARRCLADYHPTESEAETPSRPEESVGTPRPPSRFGSPSWGSPRPTIQRPSWAEYHRGISFGVVSAEDKVDGCPCFPFMTGERLRERPKGRHSRASQGQVQGDFTRRKSDANFQSHSRPRSTTALASPRC